MHKTALSCATIQLHLSTTATWRSDRTTRFQKRSPALSLREATACSTRLRSPLAKSRESSTPSRFHHQKLTVQNLHGTRGTTTGRLRCLHATAFRLPRSARAWTMKLPVQTATLQFSKSWKCDGLKLNRRHKSRPFSLKNAKSFVL